AAELPRLKVSLLSPLCNQKIGSGQAVFTPASYPQVMPRETPSFPPVAHVFSAIRRLNRSLLTTALVFDRRLERGCATRRRAPRRACPPFVARLARRRVARGAARAGRRRAVDSPRGGRAGDTPCVPGRRSLERRGARGDRRGRLGSAGAARAR